MHTIAKNTYDHSIRLIDGTSQAVQCFNCRGGGVSQPP